MFVASKLRIKLDIGGHVVEGNFILPPTPGQKYVPDPNRVGGYKISSVPDQAWREWFAHNQSSSLVTSNLIHGEQDRNVLVAWCRTHGGIKRSMLGAPATGTFAPTGNPGIPRR